MQTRVVAIASLLGWAMAPQAGAQDTLFFPATDRIAIRALKSIPTVDVAPGVHVHTIVGATGSVSLGEVDSSGVAPLHHHTREQTDVALSGAFDVTIGNRVESLGPGVGVIIPADVPHSIANNRRGVATMIEFHTVPRPDLVPPRPAMTFPVAPSPAATPAHALAVRMDAVSGATLTGATCTMKWRRLAGAVDVHPEPTATELFVYVVRGSVSLRGSPGASPLGPGTVIIIPGSARDVRLTPASAEGASLIEFRVVPR